ncbi:MAG: sigma 54-interacting transcriptional regulator, partial [Myxococcota bacterium]
DRVRVGDSIFRYAASDISGYASFRAEGFRTADGATDEESPAMIGGFQIRRILERVSKVATTGLTVLITGESGTGKELVARQLHRESGRTGPFQAINCAALPANLIESELFGYRKGSFTGATQDKSGLIRIANRGTLFLDEIGDMPPEAQSKLLRVLQERKVLPIGATRAEEVDVRVVAATHRNLDEHVTEQRFRGDLLARVRECRIDLPPLRERIEDVYSLACHFLTRSDIREKSLSFSAILALTHYRWPYNVRELESAIKLGLAL